MWEFPKIEVPYFGALIIRILLLGVLYQGPLFSETPMCHVIQAQFSLDSDPHLKQGWGSGGLRPRRDQTLLVSILGFFLHIYIYIFFFGGGGVPNIRSTTKRNYTWTIGNSWA